MEFENVGRGEPETSDYIHIDPLALERGCACRIPIAEGITSMGIVSVPEVLRHFAGETARYLETYVASNNGWSRPWPTPSESTSSRTKATTATAWTLRGEQLGPDRRRRRLRRPHLLPWRQHRPLQRQVRINLHRGRPGIGRSKRAELRPYEQRIRAGVELPPLFTRFVRSETHRLEVLRLLQGEVYNRKEVPVLAAMRSYIAVVKGNVRHAFSGELAEIPIDDVRPAA